MSIKFKNARIMTRDFNLLDSFDLVVEKNKIKSISKTSANDDNLHERVIECNRNLLMPGFKNAHAHNAMVFLRSITDDVPLEVWLNEKVFPLEAKLTEEDIYYFTILGVMENLSSGITSCADMYKMNRFLASVYYELKYRVNIVDSVTIFDKIVEPEELYLDLNPYKDADKNLIKYTIGLHAAYTNNESSFKMISDLIHKYKAPFYSHNSETKVEVADVKKAWKGLTPTEVHEEYGLYDYGGGGYHCVYFSDHDMEIFKKHNLTIVTNAASNLKLASGIAPIKKYLDYGLRVAIGTDGPASNNAIDMFREMYLVSNLSRYIEDNAVSIAVKDILKMAIENAAYSMDMVDCDALEVGKLADIILIDLNLPNMQPESTIINNLVYAGGKQNVKLTMVDGNIMYEDGEFHLFEKEEYIYKKCNELKKKILERD